MEQLKQIKSYSFEIDKKNTFFKIKHTDKSRKGNIDEKILNLINYINKLNDYYTLSSCSGRIIIYEYETMFMTKEDFNPIFTSHDALNKRDIENLKNNIKNNEEFKNKNMWLKVEPFIIHISCKSLNNARILVSIANKIGFRHSGIVGLSKIKTKIKNIKNKSNKDEKYNDKNIKKITVEIKGNYYINSPLKCNNFEISENYIDYILNNANMYFNLNNKDLKKIEQELLKIKN